jgi:hypothetical protein
MLKTDRYWILSWASWIQFAHHFLFPKLSFLYFPFPRYAVIWQMVISLGYSNDSVIVSHFPISHPSHFLWSDYPNNIWRRKQIMGLLIMQPAPSSSYFILDVNIFRQNFVRRHSQSVFSSIGLQTPDLQVNIALYIIDFNNNIVRRQESCVNDGRRIRVLL